MTPISPVCSMPNNAERRSLARLRGLCLLHWTARRFSYSSSHGSLKYSAAPNAQSCKLDADNTTGRFLVVSGAPEATESQIDLEAYPEIRHANIAHDLIFVPDVLRGGTTRSAIAMPMLAQDTVLGIIHVQLNSNWNALSETDARFFRMMSATAANALNNAHLYEEMEHKARTDFLTGLPNHRFFQTALQAELTRAHRHNHPVSLVIVDLDHLKKVNDQFGHPTGDAVIREVAETIRKTCRTIDFASRYGGEEFTIILPETSLEGAIETAERIRERISLIDFSGVGQITSLDRRRQLPHKCPWKEDLIRCADSSPLHREEQRTQPGLLFRQQFVS